MKYAAPGLAVLAALFAALAPAASAASYIDWTVAEIDTGVAALYATNSSGAWVFTPIFQSITDARSAPIGMDRRGGPVMTFNDSSHDLRWAFLYGGTWSIDFVVPEGQMLLWGNTPGLAFDADRNPRVAFRGARGLELVSGIDGGITSVDSPARTRGAALSAHPNPFNPRTTIRFDLPAAGSVHLAVYDLAGRLLRVFVEGDIPAGSHEAVWDGRDASGRAVSSGSYLARLKFGGRVATVRMALVP